MSGHLNLDQEKMWLRMEMRSQRKIASDKLLDAPGRLAERFFELYQQDLQGVVVAGYWAVGSEMSLEPILNRLDEQGTVCALPVVVGRGELLVFRQWQQGQELASGPLGTFQPVDAAALVIPQLVLTPLLAFDKTGHRLGQGGGFYDRTLARLRHENDITAIGVAYSAQQVECVPRGATDVQLDAVLTEKEILRIG
jgi:5-formyltetrahydrofolate cyclo-ligase